MHYKITKENSNTRIFKKFFTELISNIGENKIEDYIFILDNLRVHLTIEIKNFIISNKLKVLYTTPYESSFNDIEYSFR